MCLVLNRASNLAGLSLDDIANVLGSRTMLQVPTAGPELTQAVNEGRPVVLHQPRSPIARALQVVAEQVRTRVADPAPRR
jgi:MinD-like ATPase involved in chromosome partitioning or flagellar assembly